jgi:hypothetical protein
MGGKHLKIERHALAGTAEANFTFCFKSFNFQNKVSLHKKERKKTFSINRTIPPCMSPKTRSLANLPKADSLSQVWNS